MDRDRMHRYYETMCFNYETMNMNEFRHYPVKPQMKTVYKPKHILEKPPPPPNLKNFETLCEWGAERIPFHLFVKPKEIIWSNPFDHTQKKYTRPVDVDRPLVQKTRPRLLISPQVSLDDVPDDTRKMLVDDFYTTVTMANNREVDNGKGYFSVLAPLTGKLVLDNPTEGTLPPPREPVVSLESRMESMEWDNKQLRAHCDATKEFWSRYPRNRCKECDVTAKVWADRKQRIQKMMR